MSLTRREMCLFFPSALLPRLIAQSQTKQKVPLPQRCIHSTK